MIIYLNNNNMGNKKLSDYYESLPASYSPKTQFIKRVADRCNLSEQTVRLWVKGKYTPSDEKYLEILEDETGILRDNLF